MVRLLSFPREIRQIIYRYALSVGFVHPYRLQDSQETGYFTEVPNVNLLATCRQINAEASALLYSENTFFLPDTDLTIKFFTNALHNATRRAWVKSVHLGLGDHEISVSNLRTINSKIVDVLHILPHGTPWYQHVACKCYLRQVSWPRKVQPILDFLRLDSLVINFAGARCTKGCCFLTASALSAFQAGFAHGMPTNLEICGLTPCGSGLNYNVENPRRTKSCVRALQFWTKLRNEKCVPLNNGWKAMKSLVDWMEREQQREFPKFDFEEEWREHSIGEVAGLRHTGQ
ncbi:hypothetical protein MMC30_002330 [Trapelia coarctata]|nr:hypothetical protein [Trapelia coarctata]